MCTMSRLGRWIAANVVADDPYDGIEKSPDVAHHPTDRILLRLMLLLLAGFWAIVGYVFM